MKARKATYDIPGKRNRCQLLTTNQAFDMPKKGSAFQKFLLPLFWAHIYLHEPKYIIRFFHSGLNVNSNLFQFSLHTDKSFSAVKDFSNWSYLSSVIELHRKKNVSSASITSTNTLFCCHSCQFFTAYVVLLPNIKKSN